MKQRNAFTLVEMLVVITIIGILSFLAVSSYGSARRTAQLNILVDTVVSSFKQQQGLAKSGRVDEDGYRKCYGLYFSKADEESNEGSKIQDVETRYYAFLEDGVLGKADWCDLDNVSLEDMQADGDYELKVLKKYGQKETAILILFKPPFGRIVVGNLSGVNAPEQSVSSDINIGIALLGEENTKSIRFDTATGLAERVTSINE